MAWHATQNKITEVVRTTVHSYAFNTPKPSSDAGRLYATDESRELMQ